MYIGRVVAGFFPLRLEVRCFGVGKKRRRLVVRLARDKKKKREGAHTCANVSVTEANQQTADASDGRS